MCFKHDQWCSASLHDSRKLVSFTPNPLCVEKKKCQTASGLCDSQIHTSDTLNTFFSKTHSLPLAFVLNFLPSCYVSMWNYLIFHYTYFCTQVSLTDSENCTAWIFPWDWHQTEKLLWPIVCSHYPLNQIDLSLQWIIEWWIHRNGKVALAC